MRLPNCESQVHLSHCTCMFYHVLLWACVAVCCNDDMLLAIRAKTGPHVILAISELRCTHTWLLDHHIFGKDFRNDVPVHG